MLSNQMSCYIFKNIRIVISFLQDGSVIIHTVRKGHYMRTLRPPHNMDYVMNIPMLAVDDMGHIIVYCHETFPIDPKVCTDVSCRRYGTYHSLLP